jgi:hypothetical protein
MPLLNSRVAAFGNISFRLLPSPSVALIKL